MDDHKYYYVSAIDGAKRYLIAGPYLSHDQAMSLVAPIMERANHQDGRAWFMAWGTAGSDERIETPLGVWLP